MGKPMAANLLRAGYAVSFFSRRPETIAELTNLGGAPARSSCEAAEASDAIVTMLPDTAAVEAVLFGQSGVSEAIRPGAVVIDMSTISPKATMEFAARFAAMGCGMLDAPVSGGEKGAIEGTLSIMAGGEQQAFETVRPILQAMGRSIVYTGPSGNGQKTKLVNQLVGATNLLGAVEGLRLAHAAGLDLNVTLEAVSQGAAGSWMLANLGPRILREDFAPGFSIRLQHKDLRLLHEWTSEFGSEFPAAELAYSLFSRALEIGLGEQGNQGLINLWKSGTLD
jgi:3-hydroxyisobutyrate dehydrogenase